MPDFTREGLDALDHFAVHCAVGETYHALKKRGAEDVDRDAMTARAFDAWVTKLTDGSRYAVREHYRPAFDAVAPMLRAGAWDEGFMACQLQANGITGPVRNPHLPDDYPTKEAPGD